MPPVIKKFHGMGEGLWKKYSFPPNLLEGNGVAFKKLPLTPNSIKKGDLNKIRKYTIKKFIAMVYIMVCKSLFESVG